MTRHRIHELGAGPADDGSFFPAENAVLHRNLLAAYGPATVAAADSG